MGENTSWQLIYKHLKNSGFEVYSPAQHKGDCLTSYIVVKDAGKNVFNDYSSTSTTYDVMCYVPARRFSELEAFMQKVKQAMKELGDKMKIKSTDFETASFYDDSIKGYMVSAQYIVYKSKQ